MSEENDNLSEEEKIEQENLFLKSKVLLQGGTYMEVNKLDPEIENLFLKNIFEVENAIEKPTKDSLGIRLEDFPPADGLSEHELNVKYHKLLDIMLEHNIEFGPYGRVPDRVAYDYLVQHYLTGSDEELPSGWVSHIDGCSGYCPDCWQKEYCESADWEWIKKESGG